MRARIDDATNAVLSTDYWATGVSSQVDITSGPDGALYYVGVGTSNVFRATYNASSQGIIVGNLNLRADEHGQVVTTVRLATQPAGNVQVDVARVGGITPWLKVAHLAESCNLAVAPHFLMELHVSLTTAVPNGAWLEYEGEATVYGILAGVGSVAATRGAGLFPAKNRPNGSPYREAQAL